MSENPELPNVPHPNWVALSTCHLRFKRFVKAKEQDCFTSKEEQIKTPVLNGEEIKKFYEETIANKTFSRQKKRTEVTKCETIEISDSDESDIEIVDPDVNQKLLKAIQNCDFDVVKSLTDCDFNCTDQYGWTALEIACVVGNPKVVNYLIERGGYLQDVDKVFNILVDKGLTNIIDILGKHCKKPDSEVINVDDAVLERCEDCGEMFDTDEKALHIARISHQVSLKRDYVKRNPGFGISEANIGFQLMKKSGWDGVSGLGENQMGKLFPVKTILKQDRKGLNTGDKKMSRVTHFGPNDEESVTNRKYLKKDSHNRKMKKVVKRGSKSRMVSIPPEQTLREDLGGL